MAKSTTTRRSARRGGTKRQTSTRAAETAPKTDGRVKHDNTKLTATVVSRTSKGEKLSAVAEDLGIAPGKAAFLLLMHEADENPKLQLRAKDEDGATEKIQKARDEDLLSWGQIAARLFVGGKRLSEPKIKKLYGKKIVPVHKLRPKTDPPKATAKGKSTAKESGAKRGTGTRRRRAAAPDPS